MVGLYHKQSRRYSYSSESFILDDDELETQLSKSGVLRRSLERVNDQVCGRGGASPDGDPLVTPAL